MISPEQHPASQEVVSISPTDAMILDLLNKARVQREMTIVQAARAARSRDDILESDSSFSGIVAQEAVALHDVMMRRNSRMRRLNPFRDRAITLKRGAISHTPRSYIGRNHYPVTTPLLFTTSAEFAGEVHISDGYVFATDHLQDERRDSNPSVSIDRVFQDSVTGVQTKKNEYVVHVYEGNTAHPYGYVTGNAIVGEWPFNITRDPNDERIVPVIGLIRMARLALEH